MDSLAPEPHSFSLSLIEKECRVALSYCGVSARQFWSLLDIFASAEAVSRASLKALQQVVSKAKASQIQQCFAQGTGQYLQRLEAQGIKLCFFEDPRYPESLRQIYDPPFLLYWQGQDLWTQLHHAVSIVGTRRSTPYGLKQTRRMAHYLVRQGQCVVSGMALGIDAAAHRAVLENQGHTVAVLGSGLLRPSPKTHLKLFQALCAQGMVISEFAPEVSAQTWTFPMRNRIVSGLSQALVVIEAAAKSGTLITVDCATEQGREVFALPGPVDSEQSQGTHGLIQQGAHLLAQPENLAEVMGWALLEHGPSPKSQSNGLTNTQQGVYEVLSESPQSVENIVHESGCSLNGVLAILTELEIEGLVEALPGKLYRRHTSS